MATVAEKTIRRTRRIEYGIRAIATILVTVTIGGSPASGAEDYSAAITKLVDDYGQDLEELALWCDEQGLAAQAAETRGWLKPRDPNRLFISVLPDEVGPPDPPEGAGADVVSWHKRFHQLRREQAGAYYTIARKAAKVKQASLAFDLIMAALRENPDHESIRRLLGFRQYRGQWMTQYEMKRARVGYVWHKRFGWIKRGHVAQYEEGKRYYNGRWITAEQDAQLHADIRNGWVISTEHYNILTNRSIEEAVALGEKLEGLYRVWKQLFIRYYATDAQVAGLFEGRAANIQLPQHNVVYFRDRADYIRTLKPYSPGIEISLGIYIHGIRDPNAITQEPAAYFFAGQDSDEATLQHEAVHQLFHESRRVSSNVGRESNFWVIEGVAMYFESLKEENGSHVLGGFDTQRVLDARYRLLKTRFYIPLSDFCSLGMGDIQQHKDIGMLYSQAAGLFFFLVHYDNGRYRDNVVDYLNAVYNGTDSPDTLSRLTGQPLEELDRQYAEFMVQGGE